MKKLCKSHHVKHEHKLCKAHNEEHGLKICKGHQHKHEEVLAKSETEMVDDCPYCEPTADHNDCPYCAEYDSQASDDHSDCPYCQELDTKQGANDNDGCPYCQEMQSEAKDVIAADGTDDGNSPDNCPECQKLYGQAVEEQPGQTGQEPPKTQGHETAEEVLDLLDQEPGTGTPPEQEAKQIDNTEMPQGDAMEDGTAVTEDFGPAQKSDISDEERDMSGDDDRPDMASVLQSGLDDHANEQKRQQVIDQVAQTLQGFKANKQMLEATKEQNMPLYNSCIQMLKSMIALCDLLGLKPEMAQPQQETPAASPSPAETAPGVPPQAEGQSDPKAEGQQVLPPR